MSVDISCKDFKFMETKYLTKLYFCVNLMMRSLSMSKMVLALSNGFIRYGEIVMEFEEENREQSDEELKAYELNYKKSYEGRYVVLCDEFSGYVFGKVDKVTSFLTDGMMTALLREVIFISRHESKFSVSNIVLAGVCYKEEFIFHRNSWSLSYPHHQKFMPTRSIPVLEVTGYHKGYYVGEQSTLVFNDSIGGGVMWAGVVWSAKGEGRLIAHTHLDSNFQVKYRKDCIRTVDPRWAGIKDNFKDSEKNYIIENELKNSKLIEVLNDLYIEMKEPECSDGSQVGLKSHIVDSRADFIFDDILLNNCAFPEKIVLSEDNDEESRNIHLLGRDFRIDKQEA